MDLVSLQGTQKAFLRVTAQGGGDVAHTFGFQHLYWRSLVTAKLVHGLRKEGHRDQR